jgi:HD-GYP domain-containing protein (c-di-GMP phosphodiesterase class II)
MRTRSTQTPDRPYQRALSVREALEEVRAGRGTQFAPEVVDAFLATFGRRKLRVVPETGDQVLQAAG